MDRPRHAASRRPGAFGPPDDHPAIRQRLDRPAGSEKRPPIYDAKPLPPKIRVAVCGSFMGAYHVLKELLEVFSRLRDWRRAVAEKAGVPVDTIFTNEQPAQMVQKKVNSQAALKEIEGVGEARVEKCGEALVQVRSVPAKASDGRDNPHDPAVGGVEEHRLVVEQRARTGALRLEEEAPPVSCNPVRRGISPVTNLPSNTPVGSPVRSPRA